MTNTREENAAEMAADEERRARMVPVFVAVTGEPSRDSDRLIPGVYLVDVDQDLSDGQMAEVALDHFHENNGIDCLDDFAIRVLDADGREFPRMDGYENDSLSAHGEYGGFVDGIDVPDAVLAAIDTGGQPAP